jgi:hypothetical protein
LQSSYDYPNLPSTPRTKRHTLTGITGAQVNACAYGLTGNTITESAVLGIDDAWQSMDRRRGAVAVACGLIKSFKAPCARACG